MYREHLIKLWNEAWDSGLWAASWSKSVEGLTPAQAAWKPAPQRHSIWQIVAHIAFWREESLRRLADQPKSGEDVVARMNFPDPTEVTEPAWQAARRRLKETQDGVLGALSNPNVDPARLSYVLAHDCYHMGQINMLRAMQGLAAIE